MGFPNFNAPGETRAEFLVSGQVVSGEPLVSSRRDNFFLRCCLANSSASKRYSLNYWEEGARRSVHIVV